MNSQILREKLQQLDEASWQQLLDGKALRLVDDDSLEVVEASERGLIVPAQSGDGMDAATLRTQLLEQSKELLEEYYLRNPLSLTGFNRQVRGLIGQHGAAAFAAKQGQQPELSLFEEKGELLAEDSESPRHPYGAYCEVDEAVSGPEIVKAVMEWLESGEAYESYISMNVCRYSC